MKAMVIFSGGPDSTAAALWALEAGYSVELLSFQFRNEAQYGELYSSMRVAHTLNLPQTILNFTSPMHHFDSKVYPLMHAGTNTGDVSTKEDHRLTFGAGMVLTTAANFALYHRVYKLVWGTTRDDAGGDKFDYTEEFSRAIASLVSRTAGRDFSIETPLASMHKHELTRKYFSTREHLYKQTWSCKIGTTEQCGECHACLARRVSARLAGVMDDTKYTVQEVAWPVSEEQFRDPSLISEDQMIHVLASPKPGSD